MFNPNTYIARTAKEQAEEARYWRRVDKQDREERKQAKLDEKANKIAVKRELAILNFMAKTGFEMYYYGKPESRLDEVLKRIEDVKVTNSPLRYDPYIWNRQGEGNNYLPQSQMGCIWNSSRFGTIYDVPLDGSYIFYAGDSGERGLGSFHYMSAKPKE
jgi:hypothetical protein